MPGWRWSWVAPLLCSSTSPESLPSPTPSSGRGRLGALRFEQRRSKKVAGPLEDKLYAGRRVGAAFCHEEKNEEEVACGGDAVSRGPRLGGRRGKARREDRQGRQGRPSQEGR